MFELYIPIMSAYFSWQQNEINLQASIARTLIFSITHLSESNGPKRIGDVSPYPVRLEGLPAAAGRGADRDGRGGGAEGELGGGGGGNLCVMRLPGPTLRQNGRRRGGGAESELGGGGGDGVGGGGLRWRRRRG